MLDAQPAAIAPARPPAIQPLHTSPAIADTTGVSSKPAALLAAATALLPELEAGRALDAKTLREAMSAAFGANNTQGAWVWKDAYEAAEAAMVLFIQRYGRPMRREAGAGPGSAAAMLAMLETLAALEPSQTRRSEEQLALQQFTAPNITADAVTAKVVAACAGTISSSTADSISAPPPAARTKPSVRSPRWP